jgi:hypothetical protein
MVAGLSCGLVRPVLAQSARGPLGPAGAAVQDLNGIIAALTTQVVRGAPYSADAVTTMSQVLADGTKIDRTVTAKVFRDGEGRTRREQTVLGLASLSPASDALQVITIADPVAGVVYTLDPATHTARQRRFGWSGGAARVSVPRATSSRASQGAGQPPATSPQTAVALDTQRQRELSELLTQMGIPHGAPQGAGAGRTSISLGSRQVDGLTLNGRRVAQTIPAGQIGNDRAIAVTDETWESPELHVLVSSRHTDPRTGTIEYRLTNLVRAEPPADLFTVPAGYTIFGAEGTPAAEPSRGGGARGRPTP